MRIKAISTQLFHVHFFRELMSHSNKPTPIVPRPVHINRQLPPVVHHQAQVGKVTTTP